MACDDAVVSGMNLEERNKYAKSVLQYSRAIDGEQWASVGFSNGALKKRLVNVVKKKSTGRRMLILIVSFVAVVFVLTFAIGVVKQRIGEDEMTVGNTRELEKWRQPNYDGITVYVWETGPDNYLCGMIDRTSGKTVEFSDIYAMISEGITIEDMREKIDSMNVRKDEIQVLATQNPLSSYSGHSPSDRAYQERLRTLLLGEE